MTVTELVVKIGADLSGFQNGMNKLEGQLKSVGSSMQSVGMKMTGALTVPIGILGGAMIKAAADAEEMQGMFNTVFKNVGGPVSASLAKFGKEVGRSRFELMQMAAEFGDTLKPMGFTEEAAGDLSVELTKLATDLNSFKNIPMEESLQRLIGTLVGSHENALKFGVIINENVLKQELARMGADKLTGSMREQAKVQARINLLMAGTSDAQGDAVRTSGSFTNQLRGLQSTIKEVSITIGQLMLPYATELVGKLRGVANAISNLSPETVELGLKFLGVVAAVGPAIFVMGSLASSLGSVFKVIGLLSGLMSPWTLAVTAAATAAIYMWKNWEQVSASIKGVYDSVKEKFKPALNEIVTLVDGVIDIGAAIFGTLLTWWTDNKAAVLGAIGAMWDNISTAFSVGAEAVGVILNIGLDSLKEFWNDYGASVVGVVGLALVEVVNMTTNIMGILGGIIKLGLDASKGDWSTAWETMKGIVETQTNATKTTISNFANAIPGILGGDDGKGVASGDSVGAEDMRKKLSIALDAGKKSFSDFSSSILGSLSGSGGASESVDNFKGDISEAFGSTGIIALVDGLGGSIAGLKTVIGDNLGDTTDLDNLETSFEDLKKTVSDTIGNLGAGATIADFKTELAKTDVQTSLSAIDASFGSLSMSISSDIGTGATGDIDGFKLSVDDLTQQKTLEALSDVATNFTGVKTSVDELTAPTVIENLGKVNTIFLGMSLAAGAILKPVDEAKKSVDKLFESVPDTLPDVGFDVKAPDAVSVGLWTDFFDKVSKVADDMFGLDMNFRAFSRGVEAAFGENSGVSKFFKGMSDVVGDISLVASGIEALNTLLSAETWITFANNLWDIVSSLGSIIVKLGEAILGWIGYGTAQATATGVDAVTGAAGAAGAGSSGAGGAGALAGAGTFLAAATAIYGLFQYSAGLETAMPWPEYMNGVTTDDWSNLSGLFGGNLNLAGAGGLDWSWLQGGFGSAFGGGSGDWSGRAQNITINLDGRQIARSIMPYTVDELMINGTTY